MIECIFYDGLLYRTEADECVQVVNLGDTSEDMAGWRLMDVSEGFPILVFPTFILEPGQRIRVYTNDFHPEWGGFSFGYGRAVWNNRDSDVAALFDARARRFPGRAIRQAARFIG